MDFIASNMMKITILKEQEQELVSKEKTERLIDNKVVFAYDIYHDDQLIGFAMLRRYHQFGFFLWSYAIDYRYQNRHYGSTALQELIQFLKEKYHISEITTTYRLGNNHAKYLYEKIGFVETDVIEEDNCQEVNMIYKY